MKWDHHSDSGLGPAAGLWRWGSPLSRVSGPGVQLPPTPDPGPGQGPRGPAPAQEGLAFVGRAGSP